MEMVAYQAVAVQFKLLAIFAVDHRLPKRFEVALLAKHMLAIVATVDHVVN
jgi:hypothetical protein